jgi:hypothetical protein
VRQSFNRFIATILLAAFSAYLVPNEFVHALYGHEDTHEAACANDVNAIGVQHIHCDFLSYEASLYTVSSVTTCPVSSEHAFAFISLEAEHAGITFACHPSLRGPPALV